MTDYGEDTLTPNVSFERHQAGKIGEYSAHPDRGIQLRHSSCGVL